MRRYRISFEPLTPEAITFLSWATSIDFMLANFADEQLWFCCTVFEDDDRVPVVVIVFEFKTEWDAHFTLAVAEPKALTRSLITTLARTVFARAARITALVEPSNHLAMKQVWRMGFKQEGYLRRGYNGISDAVLWGLLPEECPYLRGKPFRYRVVQQTHPSVMRIQ